jgi:tripartite-type tricarboxylate transporter receptor subunit TctC
MKNKLGENWIPYLLAVLFAGLAFSQASAAEVSFKGKTVTIILTSSPGGGTDSMGRLVGRYLQEYLPGKPVVIYQNIAGAAGIKALNYLVQQVARDGLTSVAGSASSIDPTAIRKQAVQYDTKTLQMYGAFPAPSGLIILRKDALNRFNDKSLPPAIMGEVDSEREAPQMAVWGPRYLGWNVKWVLGYRGTPELLLALQRGEIDMMVTYGDSLFDQLKESDFVFPAQTGDVRRGKLVPSKRFPDVPIFSELAEPKLKEPGEVKAFAAWKTLTQIGKWLALPPDTPAEIVAVYRQAFAKITEDTRFQAEASRILGEDFTTISGDDMAQVAATAAAVGDEELKFFDQLREKVGIQAEPKK